MDQIMKDGKNPHSDLEMSHSNSTDVGKLCSDNEVRSSVESVEDKRSVEDMKNPYECEDSNMICDSAVLTEKVSDRKRKRDHRWRMLDWVVEVAKNPCDPEFGSLPERPKWKYYGSEQLWKQVLLAREATFLTRNADTSAEQSISNWLSVVPNGIGNKAILAPTSIKLAPPQVKLVLVVVVPGAVALDVKTWVFCIR
ncbi:hypothetical protein U1Q18_023600 [Sarracenia purpurea var. burkii]